MNQPLAFRDGRQARDDGKLVTDNPYPRTARHITTSHFSLWEQGWCERDEELRRHCTYPNCKCIVQTSTSQPDPVCPHGYGFKPGSLKGKIQ